MSESCFQYSCFQHFTKVPKQHVCQGFSYNHALFRCQWLFMDEIYFLGWSLNMTSTCLEHKTRITQADSRMEKKSLFHDVAYAIILNYQLVNNMISYGQVDQALKNYFNLEIDRHLSLGPSWMVISDYSVGYLLTKTHHLLHIIYFFTKTHHFCCILAIFSLFYIGS